MEIAAATRAKAMSESRVLAAVAKETAVMEAQVFAT